MKWYNTKNRNTCFECPKKSLLKSSYQKKYLPKFSYPKKSPNRKFQTQKNPSIIPVTWNPERGRVALYNRSCPRIKNINYLISSIICRDRGWRNFIFTFLTLKRLKRRTIWSNDHGWVLFGHTHHDFSIWKQSIWLAKGFLTSMYFVLHLLSFFHHFTVMTEQHRLKRMQP